MNIKPQSSRILQKGTKLPHNYIIDSVLGEGGFGITYSGYLQNNREKIAIKEYFPSELSYRHNNSDDTNTILPYTGSETSFKKGCEHFRKEASILKEFQHLQSIVSIKDVIEANGTVYLVMEYIDGITLKQYIKENGVLSYDELLSLITPVIQALIQIHKKGLLHRDISPENIMVGTDNQFHLIDFGAASYENSHITKTITVILKSGYAPPEQYLSDGKQGAWTDVYALAATMYYALTSITPTDSIRRMQADSLPSLTSLTSILSWQATAIEKGMHLSAALRFQSMETFYQALRIPPIAQNSIYDAYIQNSIEENKTIIRITDAKQQNLFTTKQLIIGIIIIFSIIGAALIGKNLNSNHLSMTTQPSSIESDKKKQTQEITKNSSSFNVGTTEQPTVEDQPTTENTSTPPPSDSVSSVSTTTATTQTRTTIENTTQERTEKQNYNVVPDDEDSYEVIHLK